MNTIGFPNMDLYSDHEAGGSESFWPSFTDIMMVIVMTFLLITVAVILNNWRLIENLQASIAAEQQAKAKAQSALQIVQAKSRENETLEERLTRLESLLAARTQSLQQLEQQQQQTRLSLDNTRQALISTRQQAESLQQENREQADRVAALQQALEQRQQQLQALQQQVDEKAEEISTLQQSAEQHTQQIQRLEQEKAAAQAAAQSAGEKLDSMNETLEKTGKELEILRQKDREGRERLVSLQGEYDELDKKYQKLLRPARSSKNKHVVRVIFSQSNGKKTYQLADEGETPRHLSLEALHQQLAKLKEKHADDLYVKIIIPEGSPISHSEAWKFTSDILNRYDYYHLAQ